MPQAHNNMTSRAATAAHKPILATTPANGWKVPARAKVCAAQELFKQEDLAEIAARKKEFAHLHASGRMNGLAPAKVFAAPALFK